MAIGAFSKKQAFLTHFSISLAIFVVLAWLVVFHWYPSYYFHLDGGYRGLATLFFVDVVIGPGLTLLVYKPGKPHLKFDMTVIILLQLAALSWGIKSTWEDRSAVTVFYLGKFSCLSHTVTENVDPALTADSDSQGLVLLPRPDNRQEYSEFLKQAVDAGSSEIYYYGDRFERLDRDNVKRVESYRFDAGAAARSPEEKNALQAFREAYPDDARYRLYPLTCRFAEVLAVFDTQEIEIVDSLPIATEERAVSLTPLR